MVGNTKQLFQLIHYYYLSVFSRFYNFNLIKNFVPIISTMMYIRKIDDYLKILTDDELEILVAINFG